MPSGSTRLTATFLYSFPLIALKSSATAIDAKHAIKKARIFILFSLRKSQAPVLSAYGMSYKIFPGGRYRQSLLDKASPPLFSQGLRAPDFHGHNSISARNSHRFVERDRKILPPKAVSWRETTLRLLPKLVSNGQPTGLI